MRANAAANAAAAFTAAARIPFVAMLALAFSCAVALVMHRLPRHAVATHRVVAPAMQVGMSGGDLQGGRDEERNAAIRALKSSFYKEDGDAAAAADDGPQSAILHDLPIARFRVVLMPHQQTAFNIFQPALIHLFETLLSTPKPWYFATAMLPGGVDNLANEEYALPGLGADGEAGPSATLTGTLSEVVFAERMTDARLFLVVHCLGRALVLRGTQALPFSRATVLRLPDTEALRAAAAHGGDVGAATFAAAAAEDFCWKDYEFADPWGPLAGLRVRGSLGRIGQPPQFPSFAPGMLVSCARNADTLAGAEAAGDDASLIANSTAAQAALAVVSEVDDEAAATVEALEVQVWLELDSFLRLLASRNGGAMPAPAQVLSLMPPPPAAGWPEEFMLSRVVLRLREIAAKQRATGIVDLEDAEPYVPCSTELYSARRRAQRLSFTIWCMIRAENHDLQKVLETQSTSDRLRLAVLRLREMREQARGQMPK